MLCMMTPWIGIAATHLEKGSKDKLKVRITSFIIALSQILSRAYLRINTIISRNQRIPTSLPFCKKLPVQLLPPGKSQ